MPLWYVSGCNTRVPLDQSEKPKNLTPVLCATGALRSATDGQSAKEICRRCPKAEVQAYLEGPPPAAQLEAETTPFASPTTSPAASPEPIMEGFVWGVLPGQEPAPAEPVAPEPPAPEPPVPTPDPAPVAAVTVVRRNGDGTETPVTPAPTPAPTAPAPPKPQLAFYIPGACVVPILATAAGGAVLIKLGEMVKWVQKDTLTEPPPAPPAPPEPEPAPPAEPDPPHIAATKAAVERLDAFAAGERPEPPEEPFPVDLSADNIAGWAPGQPTAVRVAEGPSLSQLLAKVGVKGGPSLFGTTALGAALRCLRYFFWSIVMGWKPRRAVIRADGTLDPLSVGILLHACHELYVMSGFDADMGLRPIEAVKADYPELGSEGYRLFDRYLTAFRAQDEGTWDVRAVELETRYYFEARKVGNKRRRLCITSRHDTVIRQTTQGQRLPLEEKSPDPLELHDLKTIANVTANAIRAYRHSLQVLQGLLTWNHGYYTEIHEGVRYVAGLCVERFGEVREFLVTHIGKAKATFDPAKHTGRAPYVVKPELVTEFRDRIADVMYEEIAPRLFHPSLQDPGVWPKNYGSCHDKMRGDTCPFMQLCELGSRADPSRIFDREPGLDPAKLEMPRKIGRPKKGSRKKTNVGEGENK